MGVYEEQIWSDSGSTLATALDWTESDFRQDFDHRWGPEASAPPEGLEHDDWLNVKKTIGLARQVADVAATLLRRKGLGKQTLATPDFLKQEAQEFQRLVDRLLKLVDEKHGTSAWWRAYEALLPAEMSDPRTRYSLFVTAFQLETAKLVPYDVSQVTNRLHSLVGYLVVHRGERMASYLSRVARCYALNLSPEFAVMARAVLDATLQDAVDDETVRRTVGAKHEVGLERRITYFEAIGTFDGDTSAAARRVKKAGDDAVHVVPGLEPAMEILLSDLVKVLNSLPSTGGSSERRG